MAKWNVQIDTKKLRQLIDDENHLEILKELDFLYGELITKFDDDDVIYEIENNKNLLVGDDEIINQGDFEDYGFDDAEELIDCRLTDFWDFCDDYRIWCEL